MEPETYVYEQGTSHKFWSVRVEGTDMVTHWGRVGTAGQEKAKGFDSAAAAEAAARKAAEEKRRKGYVPADGEPAASGATPTRREDPPPAAAERQEDAPAAEPAPEPEPALEPEPDAITLRFGDAAVCAFLPLEAPPEREPQPFDPAAASAFLRAEVRAQWGWWHWSRSPVEGPLTREAATYWLRIAASRGGNGRHDGTPREAHEQLMADGVRPFADFQELWACAVVSSLPDGDAMAGLVALADPAEVLDALVSTDDGLGAVAPGVRRHLTPLLDDDQRARLREAAVAKVRAALAADPDAHLGGLLALAAQAGAHEEVEAVIAGWPDGWLGESWTDSHLELFGVGSVDVLLAERERLKMHLTSDRAIGAWLAATGLEHRDAILRSVANRDNKDDARVVVRALADRVHAAAAAPDFLELVRSSRAPAEARAWLEAHPQQAAAGLAPLLGRSGQLAEDARDHLRRMARGPQRAVVEAVAAQLPDADAARLRERVLDDPSVALPELDERPAFLADAAERLGPRPKKLPAWLDAAALPPLVVGDGRLGAADAEVVVQTLRASTLEEPDPAVAALRERIDPEALEAFGWDVFTLWLGEGAPSKDKWALLQLGLTGGDRAALRLAPMVRVWPGESQHQRAVLGLAVLGAIGTETALMQLDGIAQKIKFKGLKERAREAMEAIADARGLSRSELEDRIVPTAGLDERGRRTFDYGPRQFAFVLGPGLKPMVRDPNGKLRASPPPPGAKDDPDLAARARDDWKLLRKTIADVAKIQAGRLEQAMVSQRRWPAPEFQRFVLDHPLQRHLARLLIFGAYRPDGTLRATFRPTEEGDLADAGDGPLALQDDDRVGVVHPLQLDDAQRAAWGEIQADYEIVPPFAQLQRTVRDLEPAELDAEAITRFADAKVPPVTLVGILERTGWTRGPAADAGFFNYHHRRFDHADLTVFIEYEGIPMGYMTEAEDQAVDACFATRGAPRLDWYATDDRKRAIRWREVDPIVRSEVLGTLNTIAEKAVR